MLSARAMVVMLAVAELERLVARLMESVARVEGVVEGACDFV